MDKSQAQKKKKIAFSRTEFNEIPFAYAQFKFTFPWKVKKIPSL